MRVSDMIEQVHTALARGGRAYPMEDVVGLCPDLTWNQVFLAIDYLSRIGRVCVTRDVGRTYQVQAVPPLIGGRVVPPALTAARASAHRDNSQVADSRSYAAGSA